MFLVSRPGGLARRVLSYLGVLSGVLTLVCLTVASAPAQSGGPPSYAGIVPANPLCDLPLVASSGWANAKAGFGVGGTWQIAFKPVRDCASFRLAYANSTIYENTPVAHRLYLRAALFVVRPKMTTVVRQVTFHHGDAEVALDTETLILSDAIPEYWKATENGTAYIRTYVRVETPDAVIPYRTDLQTLTGNPVRNVTSPNAAPDLTMAPATESKLTGAAPQSGGFGPVAIFGDADPTLPSVAIIGSSSVADASSYPALALRNAKIPFVLLSATGTMAADYNAAKLRPQADAACSHAFVQYGRNDIGYYYNGIPSTDLILAGVETNLSNLWKRLKIQGAWVAQTTITPRTTGTNFADPNTQTPSTAETPLRLPLNDWIRRQPALQDTPLDAYYEMADTAEYFANGQRTNKWNYLVVNGKRQAMTSDGLHPNATGNTYFSQKIHASDFTGVGLDVVPPTPADAAVSADGTRLTLRFNEAKTPPLLSAANIPGFTLTVNGFLRPVVRALLSAPKEATLYVGGAAIAQGDVVAVNYTPDASQPLTDSALAPNPVNAFTAFPADNKSSGAILLPEGPLVILGGVPLARNGNAIEATVLLRNDGSKEALKTRLWTAQLNGVASTIKTPILAGTIAPGASVAVTVSWPAPASGANALLHFSGTLTGGTFATSVRVVIP